MGEKVTGYVVYYVEELRDEHIEGAKCFETLDEACSYINGGRWFGNYTFRIFEMGQEVKLEPIKVKEHEKTVVKERTVYRVSTGVEK